MSTNRRGRRSKPKRLGSELRQATSTLPQAPPRKVAIVDWGIQRDHQALVGQPLEGHSVIAPETDFRDDDGHGTLLAGTVAGIANGFRCALKVASPAPAIELLAVKFIDVLTPPMSDNAAKAIRYAVKNGARIINASWDVGLNSAALRSAIADASERALVVVAAGNNGGNNDEYRTFPANVRLPNVISVMATDLGEEDDKPWFSNYGRETVDIAAPGVDIISTSPYLVPSNYDYLGYRAYSGTSAAAAQVSGAAAVLQLIKPDWKPKEIRDCLVNSVDHIPGLDHYCRARGRLNLCNAVTAALKMSRSPSGTSHSFWR